MRPLAEPESERSPTLIKAALALAQFGTIHPFLDGNGPVEFPRITLPLCFVETADQAAESARQPRSLR